MKIKTFAFLSILSAAVFLLANIFSARLPEPMSEKAVRGKQVWHRNNCVGCHTLFGNGGYISIDLTDIMTKRSREELKEFFFNPPVMSPHRQKRHPGLTREEAEDLLDYLEFVSTVPTLGWPPPKAKAEDSP